MQDRQQRRLIILLPVALILFSLFAAGYVFLPRLMAEQLISQIARESSVVIVPEQAHYSLMSGEMVINGLELEVSEAVKVSSNEVRLTAGLSSLWSEQLDLSEIEFRDSEINIDLDQLALKKNSQPYSGLLSNIPVLVFTEGYLAVKSSELWTSELLETAFEQIRLETPDNQKNKIVASGVSDEVRWKLNGELNPEIALLTGQLLIKEAELESTANLLLQDCAACSFQGAVSSDLLLKWSPAEGLELSGDLLIGQGRGDIAGVAALNWESLQVDGFHYQGSKGLANTLKFNEMTARLPGDKLHTVISALQKQSLAFQIIELKDSHIITSQADDNGNLNSHFSSVSGQWLSGKQNALNFDLQGKWRDRHFMSVTGTASEKETTLQVNLGSVDMALLPDNERMIAGHDLAGSRFHLNIKGLLCETGIAGSGKVIIDELHKKPLNDDAALDLDFLTALMTDADGKISTPFVVNKAQCGQLPVAVAASIESYWSSVVANPQVYLSEAVVGDQKLVMEITAEPGKELLPPASLSALKVMSKVLSARPGLQLSIQGGASKFRDWPVLARVELESDLRELYSAVSQDRVASNKPQIIPDDVRGRLLEQMYLRTQNRKQPEVGPNTPQQRIEVAEQWLLHNWPVKPEQLTKLAQDRVKVARGVLLDEGVNASRLRLELVGVKDDLSSVTLRFIHSEQP